MLSGNSEMTPMGHADDSRRNGVRYVTSFMLEAFEHTVGSADTLRM